MFEEYNGASNATVKKTIGFNNYVRLSLWSISLLSLLQDCNIKFPDESFMDDTSTQFPISLNMRKVS